MYGVSASERARRRNFAVERISLIFCGSWMSFWLPIVSPEKKFLLKMPVK
jgi:hypothetical protein